MIPTLAFDSTKGAFGGFPTLVLILGIVAWAWMAWKRHPIERPWLRMGAVVLLGVSLSMLLGVKSHAAFPDGGSYGGLLGAWIGHGVTAASSGSVNFEAVTVVLLWLAVVVLVPIATDWFFVPTMLRLQDLAEQSQRTRALAGPFGAGAATAAMPEEDTEGEEYDLRREATAVAEPPPQARAVPPRFVDDDVRREPSSLRVPGSFVGDDVEAEDEVATAPEDVPWYARKRQREPAAPAEPEAEESFDLAEQLRRDFDTEIASHDLPRSEAPATESAAYAFDDAATEPPPLPRDESDLAVVEPEAPDETDERELRDRAPSAPTAAGDGSGDDFADFFQTANATLSASLAAPQQDPDSILARESQREERAAAAATVAHEEQAQDVAADVGGAESADSDRSLFLAAGDAVVEGQRASISFLQRTLSIGYFQAAKLLDRLEKEGVIGPYTGAVSRKVLIDATVWAEKRGA